MAISVFPSEDGLTVKFEGRARFEAAACLQRELLAAGPDSNVSIDWEQAEYIDGCVLQVLLSLQISLQKRGLNVSVKNDNLQVREYLQFSGLTSFFPLCPPAQPVVERGL